MCFRPQADIPSALVMELPVGAYGSVELVPDGVQDNSLQITDDANPLVYDLLPLYPEWPQPRIIRVTYLLLFPEIAIFDQPFPCNHQQY